MFMDWKSQYCQDCCSPQINLKIKHGPYQNPSNFLGDRNWQSGPKFYMEMQKPALIYTVEYHSAIKVLWSEWILPPQNSYVKTLMPSVMVLGDGVFGSAYVMRWRLDGIMNGINALVKEIPRSSLPLPPCEDTVRSWQSVTWWRALTRTRPYWHPDLGLLACKNCEK